MPDKFNKPKKTGRLHPRNPHSGRYDLPALVEAYPALATHLTKTPDNRDTIDFSNPEGVVALNKALLAHNYQVQHWAIPDGYLCPPIPGRADMIHYLADLLAEQTEDGSIPKGKQVQALDIGTGANCIYPIIGARSYGWKFTASDIDPVSVKTARLNVEANHCLKGHITLVHQKNAKAIFHGVIKPGQHFDITLCNPPFHASLAEAQAGTQRKWRNLHGGKGKAPQGEHRNFGGQKAELWCEGGEIAFLKQMAVESRDFAEQVGWFTSLVSKKDNLRPLEALLKKLGASEVRVIKMSQGQKISHLLAWHF
ncbi:23S rRNA (adenine(1618)-N(6))-methyltransferase RlmF [Parendozoicomonas haliclonae]|uniref:Ribosomal RNA large subunit methyltransferase F n=1 Tax=Parendozoicomonas haliclonae TaxID=1960125 RepID=A0A1X7AMQ7_9GAMM|nr:23S rRNA (adenine(1618)-N(6))-methyltransferase RlmF [Parendozoicomonas haliclonae]SMA49561.1 Ribosomal RNA large subunit methyltransferase F [Parendozoicomonas haliclonae]